MPQKMQYIIANSNKTTHPCFLLAVSSDLNWCNIKERWWQETPQHLPDFAVELFMISVQVMKPYVAEEELFGYKETYILLAEFYFGVLLKNNAFSFLAKRLGSG